MNKKIIDIILLLIFSILIEVFLFHINIFKLPPNQKGLITLDSHEKSEKIDDEEKNIIDINVEKKFVNKLRIQYQSDTDIKYSLFYYGKDYYGQEKEEEIKDSFDNEVNEVILNLNEEVSKIKIIYNKDSVLHLEKVWIDNEFHFNYLRFIYCFLSMIVIYFIYIFYKQGFKNDKLHIYFFIAGLFIGIIFIILQPSATFYSWDDQIHFKNVNELVAGNAKWNIGEFSMIDTSAVGRNSINSIEEQENQMKYLNNQNKSGYSSYGGKFLHYNSVAYIPSFIGFRLSRLIGLPFSICFKIGKVFNLVAYLLLISAAIKIAKIGKKLIAVIGLTPTCLFLASQYSYDPAVTSGIILGITMLINWLVDKEYLVTFKRLLFFLIIMMYGCLSKAVYIPLILLFIIVPKDRFKSIKQCIMVKCGIVFICLAILSTFILPTVSNNMTADDRGGNTSVSEQLKVITEHPIGYANVLKDTMLKNYSSNFLGTGTLLHLAYIPNNNANVYYLFLLLLLFVWATDYSKYSLKCSQRISIIVLLFGVILFVWTALYLAFTPIGLNTINGVQPRYFLPLLLPVLISIKPNSVKHNITDKYYNLFVIGIPTFIMLLLIYQDVLLNYCM